MKILLVHNRYTSKYIGGEDVVFDKETTALKDALGDSNVIKYEVKNDDINTFLLIFSIFFSYRNYKKIYNLVKVNKIDLVHVHNFFPILTPSVFIAAKKAGAKVVHTLHNYRFWCISGIFFNNDCGICEICARSKFGFHAIKHKCYKNSKLQSFIAVSIFYLYKILKLDNYIDYFFVLSQFQKSKLLAFDKNIQLIYKPNFVDYNKNEGDCINDTDKDSYIFVGKLSREKGILELIKVWRMLDIKFKLVIIGDGEYSNYINCLNKSNIIYLGQQSNEKVMYYIKNSKYLIQPSLLYETFGLTIIEAMSLGTPVIGYGIGTRKEFIIDEYNGFIANKIEDLYSVINKSFNYKEYKYLCENAKKAAYQYSKENVIKEQIDIYQKIINNNLKGDIYESFNYNCQL